MQIKVLNFSPKQNELAHFFGNAIQWKHQKNEISSVTQPTCTCSKSTIETPEQCVKSV